jgi:hypothetical protein
MVATTSAYFHCRRQCKAAVTRSRSTVGSKKQQPHEVAVIVEQDRRHQHELDRIAVDHGVACDENAGQLAVEHARVNASPLCRVVRGAKQSRSAGDEEHPGHYGEDARHAKRRDLLAEHQDRQQGRPQRPGASAINPYDAGSLGGEGLLPLSYRGVSAMLPEWVSMVTLVAANDARLCQRDSLAAGRFVLSSD